MAEIYGLYSCRDGAVRYVGETTYPRETRFKQHRRDAWMQDTQLRKWLVGEWRAGYPVRHVRLEWCENALRFDRETEWIGKFPNLVNHRKHSGWITLAPRGRRAPKIPEIVKYMRGHRFNVDGRRGIHYQVGTDRYCVMIFTGSDFEWLDGDASIWFSDLAAAENARERHFRFRPHRRRYPDYLVEAI
jgi:hypothetical protein